MIVEMAITVWILVVQAANEQGLMLGAFDSLPACEAAQAEVFKTAPQVGISQCTRLDTTIKRLVPAPADGP